LLITGLLLKAATEQGLMEASLAKQPTYSPNQRNTLLRLISTGGYFNAFLRLTTS